MVDVAVERAGVELRRAEARLRRAQRESLAARRAAYRAGMCQEDIARVVGVRQASISRQVRAEQPAGSGAVVDAAIDDFEAGSLGEVGLVEVLSQHAGDEARWCVVRAGLRGPLPMAAVLAVQRREDLPVLEALMAQPGWELAESTHSHVVTALRVLVAQDDARSGELREAEQSLRPDDVAGHVALAGWCRGLIAG